MTKQPFHQLLLTLTFYVGSLTCLASPELNLLDIHVSLQPNGDAVITETRQMSIDSEGTECYIVIGNLDGSEVRNLQVVDEQGIQFQNIGSWDIDLSRREKTHRCGIVTKRDGYELCWGLGDEGERIYTTTYTVTHLIRSYTDADGFNYMFVAQGVRPLPNEVRLTIQAADGTQLTDSIADIWGFRFIGRVDFTDGAIVATSSEPFKSGSALILMARFNKGTFSPEMTLNQTFEEVRETAFEGSDYSIDEDFDDGFLSFLKFVGIALCGVVLIGFIYLFQVWRARREVMKDLNWYRDIPYNGNLQEANNVLNAYKFFGNDYNNLLSACILRLIDLGAITIEPYTDSKGKTRENFVIKELKNADKQEQLVRMMHNIFQKAAGQDTILEPRELKTWMRQSFNQSVTDSFVQTLHNKTYVYQYKREREEVRKLFGLKKYLKEFSLIDERHVSEVALWKDYMIYATLFGIADQVIRDMKRINPDYFNMDDVARQMADDLTLPTIYSTLHHSTSAAAMSQAERQMRNSGGGGFTSFGGGGGFSGGGFGGGVR